MTENSNSADPDVSSDLPESMNGNTASQEPSWLPPEPGSQGEEHMDFEAAPDAPEDSEMPENDVELREAEPQEAEEEDF